MTTEPNFRAWGFLVFYLRELGLVGSSRLQGAQSNLFELFGALEEWRAGLREVDSISRSGHGDKSTVASGTQTGN